MQIYQHSGDSKHDYSVNQDANIQLIIEDNQHQIIFLYIHSAGATAVIAACWTGRCLFSESFGQTPNCSQFSCHPLSPYIMLLVRFYSGNLHNVVGRHVCHHDQGRIMKFHLAQLNKEKQDSSTKSNWCVTIITFVSIMQ